MSDANNEISKTINLQGRRALGLTLGLACSIPLSSHAALAAGNHDHVARHNLQLNAIQQLRAERRADRRADRADRLSNLNIQNAVRGANFNLNSGREIFAANNLGNFQSLTIDVGGQQRVVTLDSKLSAAEVVAAQQVLNGGVQTIELKANGTAVGGTINLNNSTMAALDKSAGGSIGSLTVARNVSVIDSTSGISLSGNLRNLGTISAASDASGATVTISADTIHNARSGSIGSYIGSDFFSADVALNAATSLTNNGSISSAGTLTITAPVINNLNDGGSIASLSAQNVNLNTANLVNTGNIAALAGDINVASNTVLNIVGTGGSMQANNGSINFGSNNADITLTGGDLLSQDVNLTAGKGTINAWAGQVDGTVNASACVVHFNADTADLKLGNIDASGDPIVTSTGNIQITGAITPTGGFPLTLVAGGDITASPVALSTAGAAGGGDLTLLAGVQFKTVGGNINVTKKSTTGGKIDLTGITAITSNGGTGAAGDITMVAFAGKTVGSGVVTLPAGVTMTATGAGGNGDVLLLGSAKTGAAHNVGGIQAGNVTIRSSVPTFSKGGITYDGTSGALISGTFNSTKLTAGDININATVDATGDINIGTTTAVNINGSIKGSSTNAQKLSIQSANLNLNAGASILSNDDSSLTITTTQPFTVDGKISVGTLNLTAASLNITATGSLEDKIDNITTKKGGGITVNGQLGRDPATFDPTRAFTTFNINDGGTFVVGNLDPGAVVSGDGLISAVSFTNNTLMKGNTTYNATGTKGVLFTNNGTVDGQIVTVNAVKGSISNAAGAFLQATQQTFDTDVPTLTLNTLAVDNQGHIEAVGELKRTTGTLNINSTKALTITGADNSFFTDFNSTVNLSALNGDVTVGGNNGVVNSNPFGLLSSGLGNFSVVAAKGDFNSTMPGVSVTADKKGLGGTVLFTVEGIVYNGLGAAPNFNIKSVGDPLSKGIKVLTLNATTKNGITIGNGSGEISVDISGYESSSTTSITTPNNLTIDSTALKLGATAPTSTSLTLTGTKNLLITGAIVGGDNVTINTNAKKKPFQIGNATVTGINGLAVGEGVSAIKTLTINGLKGFVMDGSSLLSAETVILNGPSLEVRTGSDIKAVDLTLAPGAATKVRYANFNPLGSISAARLHITTTGTLTLDSGGGKAVETFLSVAQDKSNADPAQWEGGTFDLTAGKLAFSTKGITFNAPGNNVDAFGGGQVDLNLTATKTAKVGLGNGSIRAIVTDFGGTFPAAPGEFRLASSGAIVAKDIITSNVIQYGVGGPGVLELQAGTTVTVSGINNQTWNLFHLRSHSTQALLATDGTKNGVLDKTTFIGGGAIVFENFGGKVVTNGAYLSGVHLELASDVEIDVRKNAGSAVGFNGAFFVGATAPGPNEHGGEVIYTAPLITVDGKTGHTIYAEGSGKSGGDIAINGTGTQTLNFNGPNTGGAIYLDVGITDPGEGGKIAINNGGAIVANGAGFNFGGTPIEKSSLSLKSGGIAVNAKGFPISFSNTSSATLNGLDYGTVTIDSGSTSPFKMAGAGPNANGFTVGDLSAGKLIISPQTGLGVIDTTGYQAIVHELNLTGSTINFDKQTISVVADGAVGTGNNTGDGGIIKISAAKFGSKGGVLLSALGTGGASKGGIISVEQTGIQNLAIDASTISFNVSNPGGIGGEVSIKSAGDLDVDGNVFTYGTLDGGKLALEASGNLRVTTGIDNLSSFQLTEVDFTTKGLFSKGAVFQFGGANKNKGSGFVETGKTLTADYVKIESAGLGAGVDTTGGTISAQHLAIKTDGNVNFAGGSTLAVVPVATGANAGGGGTLEITANGFTQTGTGGYTLSAAGSTGAGGIITVNLTGTDTLVIGKADLNIDMSNASGMRGGSTIINNGGNIFADIKAIDVGANFAGAGPNLALNAKGILSVNNVADIANVGFGGGNFTTATIGGVPMTGYTNQFNIFDAALPGGVVTISYVENPGDTQEQIAAYIANQINTNPTLQSLIGLQATTTGATITLVSASNATTYTETCIAPPLPADQECPATVTLVAQTTGLTLTSQSSQAFVLGGAAVGTNGIQDVGPLALNIGALTIANTGSQQVVTISGGQRGGTDSITVTDPNLPGGFITVSYKVTANENKNSIAQGLADQINLNLALQGIGVTAQANGASVELVSTGVATSFSTVAAPGSHLDLTTITQGGDIVNGTITNLSGAITDIVTLSASGNIGTKASQMNISGNGAQGININAGGDSYFTSSVGAGTINFNTFGHTEATVTAGDVIQIAGIAGDLQFLYNNANPANTNTVSLGTFTTLNGDLSVISNSQNLNVGDSAQIFSNFGNIILADIQAGGIIDIGDSVVIHGSGAVTARNQGNVYIYTNLFPFNPVLGIPPAGVTINETGGGKVTFGDGSNPAGTITADPSAILQALGRDLRFNNFSGSIVVGKDTVITADPPPLQPSVQIFGASSRTTTPSSNVPTLQATGLSNFVGDSGASNAVPVQNSNQQGSVNVPNFSIDSAQNLLSSLGTINTIGLNNAQLTDLSSVQSSALNAIQVGNNASLLSTTSVAESSTLPQISEAPQTSDSQSRTLFGQVSNSQARKLDRGPLLVAPENDIVVETPFGKVNVAAKTLALLIASENSVAVYNLHDIRKGALTVTATSGHTFNVTPGTSAVLVNSHDKEFEDVNPARFVRYRQPVAKLLNNSHKLYRAEFEILSLLNGLPAVKDMMTSENKETRKTMMNVLKTAAILMQLSGNSEPFKFLCKPDVTAMNNNRR